MKCKWIPELEWGNEGRNVDVDGMGWGKGLGFSRGG